MQLKKVLYITNIPNPYRIPLFNEMSRVFHANNLALKIIFGAASYKRRLFTLNKSEMQFNYTILDDKGHSFSDDGEKTIFLYRGLSKLIEKEDPDAIMVAGFSTATLKVFRRNIFKGTPYIIVSGTIEKPGKNMNLIRKIQRKVLANHASAFVAYGTLAKKYLINLGVSKSNIYIGRNTVDTHFFESATAAIRKTNIKNLDKIHFTYIGYLVPRKNVMALLHAVKLLAETESNFVLDIIGDGISMNELNEFVIKNNLSAFVCFHGFKQKHELPVFLAQSDGFLFQTDYDIWGLVLNEAMAAGVPCLASPNAGATTDLIQDGKTGFVVNFNNPIEAALKMKWVMHHPELAHKIGELGATLIHNEVTIAHAVKGYVDAILSVLKKSKKTA
jgi:glycosyltransferase involved in cell wall biosynthesis